MIAASLPGRSSGTVIVAATARAELLAGDGHRQEHSAERHALPVALDNAAGGLRSGRRLAVSFGGKPSTVSVPGGNSVVYVPLLGAGNLVTVQFPGVRDVRGLRDRSDGGLAPARAVGSRHPGRPRAWLGVELRAGGRRAALVAAILAVAAALGITVSLLLAGPAPLSAAWTGWLNSGLEHYADTAGQWNSGDNAVQVELPGGRALWLFNDSFFGPVAAAARSAGPSSSPIAASVTPAASSGVSGC